MKLEDELRAKGKFFWSLVFWTDDIEKDGNKSASLGALMRTRAAVLMLTSWQ